MKKLIAILLITIHLFNIGGEFAMHQYLEFKSEQLFNRQINQNRYSLDDLTEISIPVNMPNITDWRDFENISGRIQFGDNSYNYVKMKITRKAIYLMCIPNYNTTHFSAQNVLHAGHIRNIPIPKKEHVPAGKSTMIAFHYQGAQFSFYVPAKIFKKITCYDQPKLADLPTSGPGQPPDHFLSLS